MRRFFAAAAVFALALSMVVPASANVITRTDGNDTPGPLDLAGIKVEHGVDEHIFTFRTLSHFEAYEVDGDMGWFEIGFDVNGDRDYEYIAFAAWHKAWFGALIRPNGDLITNKLKVGRPDATVLRIEIPLGRIGSPKTYDFAAFSVYRAAPCTEKEPCVDAIPNTYPLIRHDLTPPKVEWGTVPAISTDVSTSLTIPVTFTIVDNALSAGIEGWAVQVRDDKRWFDLASGSGSARKALVPLPGAGETYGLRVVARDRHGNEALSDSRMVRVPHDDSAFEFSGGWTRTTGNEGAFLGTLRLGSPGAEAKFGVGTDARVRVCLLGGPTSGGIATADIFEGTYLRETATEDPEMKSMRLVGCWEGYADRPVRVVPTSAEPFVLDGFLVREL